MQFFEEYNKNSFQHKIESVLDLVNEFTKTEKGTDMTFNDFPNQAQEIVYKLFSKSKSENELIGLLDSNNGLKEIFGTGVNGYVKEVDAIMRFYRWYQKHELAA